MAARRSNRWRSCGPGPGSTPALRDPHNDTTNVPHPTRWPRTAYEYFCMTLGYVYFGAAGLVVTLLSAVLYPVLPREAGSRLARSVIGGLFRSFLGLLRGM